MTNVVSLGREREDRRLIWVCNCGCTSHRAYADGQIVCADCDTPANGYSGEWRSRLPDEPEEPKDTSECFKVVPIDSAATFMKRRMRDGGEIAVIVVVHEDGSIATYSAREMSDEQTTWLRARLADAEARLTGARVNR